MSSASWRALLDECARWRDLGRPLRFWLRDDDARQPTRALDRLLALASGARVPVALAVIPEGADASLVAHLSADVYVLQHGCDHRNRAAAGEKKCEFPRTEPVAQALERLAAARAVLASMSGERLLNVLVPPWNRLPDALVPRLPGAGYAGLSRFGTRGNGDAIPGLSQRDTHVDVIAWHGDRGFVGEEAALGQAVRWLTAARAGDARHADEAVGWLTHHACHDEATWVFLGRLFEYSDRLPGVRWITAREVFGLPGSA